jgi:WD40 repeat protein
MSSSAPPASTLSDEMTATTTRSPALTSTGTSLNNTNNSTTGSTTNTPTTQTTNHKFSVTGSAVLEYLRKKGLVSAVIELTEILESENLDESETVKREKSARDRLEEEDVISRNQRSLLVKSTGGSYGYDRDAVWPVVQWGVPDIGIMTNSSSSNKPPMGVDEARAYLDAFVSVQLWVLSLPDDDCSGNGLIPTVNPIQRAHALLKDGNAELSLKTVMEELAKPTTVLDSTDEVDAIISNLPPSAKPELLAVTFALLVHTYCELLEVGMESTAHSVRDAFKPIYEPYYKAQYRDLYQCITTEDMMRLNSHNSQHMEALANLKNILIQVASYQLRREELNSQTTINGGFLDAQQKQAKDHKVAEYDKHIGQLKQKYNELSLKASSAFDKMYDLPFLRRARAVRWQLTVSTTTYGLLSGFLNTTDTSLLAMSTLLQTKCELHVERRIPVPFVPACVLDGIDTKKRLGLNSVEINWAAPFSKPKNLRYGLETLPFPKFTLDAEYESERDALKDRNNVEFNRALLVNGFRRLEALERKREFDVMSSSSQKAVKDGELRIQRMADASRPTILMTTLFAKSNSESVYRRHNADTDISSIWEEASVGLVCAKLCEPDGRRVAVGCDDSAVRIWSAMSTASTNQPLQVLLGHKNGFPVFDVDWNRDGRCLLSAGGDGSVRLWDTMAVGPFGEVVTAMKLSSSTVKSNSGRTDEADAMIPALRPESASYSSGAALAVYRGHAPNAPVWSVAFAPSGYYFASTGGDATARIWTTDRPVPVRLLTGHSSMNVNCIEWHPNCNYVLTGSDDKTARLWDVQTGRTVRLLSGCMAGVNSVQIDPSGRYAAVADYSGIICLWDLGTGKKVTEFRCRRADGRRFCAVDNVASHALRFSTCGTTLATGGDDCCIRIWDIQRDAGDRPRYTEPLHSFSTRQTITLDLYYSKRNLLLAAGKYVTPVPLAPGYNPH